MLLHMLSAVAANTRDLTTLLADGLLGPKQRLLHLLSLSIAPSVLSLRVRDLAGVVFLLYALRKAGYTVAMRIYRRVSV